MYYSHYDRIERRWRVSGRAVAGEGAVAHHVYRSAFSRVKNADRYMDEGYMNPADLINLRGVRSRRNYANELGIALRTLEDYEYAKRRIPRSIELLSLKLEGENE